MRKIPENPYRVLYAHDFPTAHKDPLEISDSDTLWLKRMLLGEGGRNCGFLKRQCLLWALINRWFLWPGSKNYDKFIDMVRAFSQPINPKWLPGGSLAEKFKNNKACSPARLRRRTEICNMTEFTQGINNSVELLQFGDLPNPKSDIGGRDISNWASLPSTPKNFPRGLDIEGDWFFEDLNLRKGSVVVRKL